MIYQSAWRNILEDLNLQQWCENIKFKSPLHLSTRT